MKFEVINDKGCTVMSTLYPLCIHEDDQLSSMMKAGYRFKIDGKIVSKKKAGEVRDDDEPQNE